MARDRTHRRLPLGPGHAALLLALATSLLLGWHSLADRDVWFHARAGADLLAEGGLARVNRYSFTAPEHPWLNHEWLFQAAVAATAPALPPEPQDPLWGWNLLRAGLILALGLVLLLGDGVAGRAAPDGRRLLAAGAVLAALGLLWTRLQLRPELVSYLLLAVVARAVAATLAAPDAPTRWRSWFDPRRAPGRATLATLVWAQVHGFAALVPLLWVLGLLGAVADRRGRGTAVLARRAGTGFRLGLAALAATPNGPAGLLLPLRALAQFGGDRPDLAGIIAELVPLLETRDSLGTTLLVFRLSLVWSLLWVVSQGARVPVLRVLLLVAGALAAWQAQRALGLYAVAFVLLHTGTRWPLRLPPGLRLPPRAAAAVAAVALAAVCAWWWPAIVTDRFYLGEGVARRFGHGLTPAHVPSASLQALRASGAATVVANVDAAGAVLAARGPAVFIDGRTEAYPPELWRQYGRLRAGGDGARAVLDRHRPGAVLLAYGSGAFTALAKQLLEDPAWTLRAVDGAAVLFLPGQAGPRADPRAAAAALLARAAAPALPSARAADLCLAAARTSDLVGDRAAAAAALARGAALRPDHPLVQHNLGNALLAQERFAPALAAFAAAFAANGRQAGSALNAGVCALRLGRLDEAREWFARAVGVDPAGFEGWVNLAAALQRSGDREGARRALERAVALRPGDARLQQRLRELAPR